VAWREYSCVYTCIVLRVSTVYHNNLLLQDFPPFLCVNTDTYLYRQEGWRLEHENPWDQHSSIIFKGVVFNEMKGYFASPENVYSQVAQNLLYPTTTYSKVSGGHPISILELTCDQLKAFHAEHYHPSNARFFTYGNFSLCGHLKHLNQDYLQYYVKSAVNTEIPYEPRWLEPVSTVL
ncbi:Presequence protease, mitochondrial, partial [Geodia barretti]